MSAGPVPDYDHNADLTPPHFFQVDTLDSTSCLVCGRADGYGVLHLTEPKPKPDNSAWRRGDVVQNPRTSVLFVAVSDGHGGLEWLELAPAAAHAQDHPPRDAVLLVRGGKAVSAP